MIRKDSWYEFELLQPYPSICHGTCLCPITPPQMPSSDQHPAFAAYPAVGMNQVHGTNVVRINALPDSQPTADALITDRPNVVLFIKHADCQPALLFDPDHFAIGAVHSGWRASCLNIYKAAVESMQSQFGTRPERLIACIGPSLGPCHSEFVNWRQEFPASFEAFCLPGDHFDFWAISRHQLQACGLRPENIEVAEMCTKCHPASFCSYRRDATAARNITFVATAHKPEVIISGCDLQIRQLCSL